MTSGRRINNSKSRQLNTTIKRKMEKIRSDILNPPDRHVALEQIKEIMPDREEYYNWFNKIYELKSVSIEQYEAAIFRKLESLTVGKVEDVAYTAIDDLLGAEGATQKDMESVVELFTKKVDF